MRKKQNKLMIGIFLVALMGLAFYLNQSSLSLIGFMGGDGLTPQNTTLTWNGQTVSILASVLGSTSNSASTSFCNNNDGGLSIANDAFVQETILNLKSSMGANDKGCPDDTYNFLFANLTIPKGNYSIECKFDVVDGDGFMQTAKCNIVDFLSLSKSALQNSQQHQASVQVTETRYVNFENDTPINIELLTLATQTGGASVEMKIVRLTSEAETVCPTDTFTCPTGVIVSRNLSDSCNFPQCEVITCPTDVFNCGNNTFVGRNESDSCKFNSCPAVCDDCGKPNIIIDFVKGKGLYIVLGIFGGAVLMFMFNKVKRRKR